jgi:hypothetical protein
MRDGRAGRGPAFEASKVLILGAKNARSEVILFSRSPRLRWENLCSRPSRLPASRIYYVVSHRSKAGAVARDGGNPNFSEGNPRPIGSNSKFGGRKSKLSPRVSFAESSLIKALCRPPRPFVSRAAPAWTEAAGPTVRRSFSVVPMAFISSSSGLSERREGLAPLS